MTEWLNIIAGWIDNYLWIAPLLAFAAGVLVSFTPCSLSSVPMVIAYIGGSAKDNTKKAFRLSLAMALGLSGTFLVFGALASALGHLMHEIGSWWYGLLGLIMILMALQIWGIIKIIPTHNHNHNHNHEHIHSEDCEEAGGTCHCGPKVSKKGYWGALLAGMLSGAIASHCSTPVMIALLAIAAQSGRTMWGIFLLAMFAAGHSVLLIAAGTSYSVVERFMYDPKYEKISRTLRTVMGVVILLIGFAMLYMAFFYEHG